MCDAAAVGCGRAGVARPFPTTTEEGAVDAPTREEIDASLAVWIAEHRREPRPAPVPGLHRKLPFPPPEIVQRGAALICSRDLRIRLIRDDRVPDPQ